MRPFTALLKRTLAIAAAAVVFAATITPPDADARAGRSGSFGSRGSKTWSSPPPTATAPGAQQMQRSNTGQQTPGVGQNAAANRAAPGQRPGLFGGGLGAGLMGGLLGAGLFGLLAGNGFFGGLGSLTSILGLVIQLAIIFLVARLIMNWMRNRQQPNTAAAGGAPSGYRPNAPQTEPQGSRFEFNRAGPVTAASTAPLDLDGGDFDAFEKMLSDVQDAWSKQDLSRLRTLATPEMVETFSDDLAEDASRGVVNTVSNVKLLQGDLSEGWREGSRAYATVAMRYELTDVTQERETGRVVDGDPSARQEATELWTFMRAGSEGRWILSAIQQAA